MSLIGDIVYSIQNYLTSDIMTLINVQQAYPNYKNHKALKVSMYKNKADFLYYLIDQDEKTFTNILKNFDIKDWLKDTFVVDCEYEKKYPVMNNALFLEKELYHLIQDIAEKYPFLKTTIYESCKTKPFFRTDKIFWEN